VYLELVVRSTNNHKARKKEGMGLNIDNKDDILKKAGIKQWIFLFCSNFACDPLSLDLA